MSNPVPPLQTPTGEFQAHFGSPPGSPDLTAECKKWETLCAELLAERQKAREELAKTQQERDQYLKSLYHVLRKDYKPDFDQEIAFAHIDDKPTIQELIAKLESSPGK